MASHSQFPWQGCKQAFIAMTLLCLESNAVWANEPKILKGHQDTVRVLRFSPDSKTLASGSDDNSVRFWDLDTFQTKQAWPDHERDIWDMAFSPDGRTLSVLGFGEGHCKSWDFQAKKAGPRIAPKSFYVTCMDYSKDGKVLAFGTSSNACAVLWDRAQRKVVRELRAYSNTDFEKRVVGVELVAISPNGKTLAVANWDGSIHLWDLKTAKIRKKIQAQEATTEYMKWSPNNQWLATCGAGQDGNSVQIWSVASGKRKVELIGHEPAILGTIDGLLFSANGRTIATVGGKTVKLWDVESGKCLKTSKIQTYLEAVFSPDRKWLAATRMDKEIHLWKVVDLLPKEFHTAPDSR